MSASSPFQPCTPRRPQRYDAVQLTAENIAQVARIMSIRERTAFFEGGAIVFRNVIGRTTVAEPGDYIVGGTEGGLYRYTSCDAETYDRAYRPLSAEEL